MVRWPLGDVGVPANVSLRKRNLTVTFWVALLCKAHPTRQEKADGLPSAFFRSWPANRIFSTRRKAFWHPELQDFLSGDCGVVGAKRRHAILIVGVVHALREDRQLFDRMIAGCRKERRCERRNVWLQDATLGLKG